MILSTTDYISDKKFEILGLVEGNTVQSKNMFKDIGQAFKNLVGGELKTYTQMMAEARKIATGRLIESAEALGADAVVGFHYTTSSIMESASEIIAYGTAVKFI